MAISKKINKRNYIALWCLLVSMISCFTYAKFYTGATNISFLIGFTLPMFLSVIVIALCIAAFFGFSAKNFGACIIVVTIAIMGVLECGSYGKRIIKEHKQSTEQKSVDMNEWWKQATPEILENLIKKGIDFTARDKNGTTSLMYAAMENENPELIEILIKKGVDVNSRDVAGNTALMRAAAFNGNPNVIDTLIKHGADIKAKTKSNSDALIYAVMHNKNPAVIDTLVKYGADIKVKDEEGNTLLMWAAKSNENPYIIKTLINYGIDIKSKNKDGMNALMCAAQYTMNPTTIDTLLEYGANVKVKDKKGKTAFDYAKENPFIYDTLIYWKLNDLIYK